MRDLVGGERADIGGDVSVAVGSSGAPAALALIALDAARRAAADFAPIDSGTRELRPAASFGEEGRLGVALDRMPPAVERLLLVAYDPMAQLLRRALTIETGDLRFRIDLTDRGDAAAILIELYRHRGGWRLAANGQGFGGGLVMVASAHGLDPDWARRLGHQGADPGPARGGGGGTSSGSGVAIDPHHVLSNAHVVEDGGRITATVGGRPLAAEVVFADPRNDLALLRVETPVAAVARFRAATDLHLGEDVVVLGFPLQGLLGTGPQASAGNVAALCGIGNDSTLFQFTAPIASGNSGGPILDLSGAVIGLVSASLNLDHLRRSGASAENVNFGIKGAIIRSFLNAYGIEPSIADPGPPLGRAAVVREMQGALCRIACAC